VSIFPLTPINEELADCDPHDLHRFIETQHHAYERAMIELRRGRKTSHWMWYIFPQFGGLGSSSMAQRYAIKSIAEAKAYIDHPVLGPRLVECAQAVLRLNGLSAHEIFGFPDDRKLQSCATLFAQVTPDGSVFKQLLTKYYQGTPDQTTLNLLRASREPASTSPPVPD
jgi:uncharacterized protein (DUF1810 family)